ncbi:hypothetical protein JVU11DRAFT_10733 [Chiua virens]|nr:hypothetical protein JVU11DRAFT_10733 [Chiua virens]
MCKLSEFLTGSFRKHQWRGALLLCLAMLTQGFILKNPELIQAEMSHLMEGSKGQGQSRIPVWQFLDLISQHDMIPMAIKPHSIVFLSSEQNFVGAYQDWLFHSVSRMGMKFRSQDARKMFQAICRLTPQSWTKWDLSPEMMEFLALSKTLQDSQKAWKTEAHRNKNLNSVPWDGCQVCKNLDGTKQCVQYLLVHGSKIKDKVEKKLIIAGDDGGMESPISSLTDKCVLLNDLNLGYIELDHEVYDYCGWFVVHLLNADTKEDVAGVVFNLLNDAEMVNLEENQARIKRLTSKLKCRKLFSDFSGWKGLRGGMYPVGFRQPSGGHPGDGYAPYPATEIVNQEDAHIFFAYAMIGLCFFGNNL